MKRALLGMVVLVLLAVGAGCLVGRDRLEARYYTYKLFSADDATAIHWIDRAGAWGERVPAMLIDALCREDATVCNRAGIALARAAADWPAGDPRSAALATRLAERSPQFSPA